jgi:hypothetical protein
LQYITRPAAAATVIKSVFTPNKIIIIPSWLLLWS